MTEHLSFRTRQQDPVAVVDVHGALDGATASTIADLLHEHLPEQPAADDPTPQRRILRDLPPRPDVLRTARDMAADACQSWGIDATTAAAQLVVSELLSNAIEHTGTTSDVILTLRRDQLHIVVRDRGQGFPQRPPDPRPGDARGRGLVLIDELSVAWAVVRTSVGKLVWAVLPVEGEPGRHGSPRTLAQNRR